MIKKTWLATKFWGDGHQWTEKDFELDKIESAFDEDPTLVGIIVTRKLSRGDDDDTKR